jgi:beta-1,4-mannosyl-glycoprotein beta-1,4-N-acetylglucosaminyltransferase
MKIVDCFTFYNELDLLTYRLNLLYEVVDYFIIVEAKHTFIGIEKILYYNENKDKYKEFSDKIIHVIVNDMPYKYPNVNVENNDVWNNEYHQRNAISRGINNIKILSDSDVIIISDLDEIPDPRTLYKIKNGEIIVDINILQMDFYYYNLNTKLGNKWHHSKILTYKKYVDLKMSCNDIRKLNLPVINNGGWHLSYFGDKHFIKNKLENFSHQEFNNSEYTDLDKIEKRVQNSEDLFNINKNLKKLKIEDNNYLPLDYSKYLTKYYSLF